MAIRRAKQKAQVISKLSQAAPPGETFIACTARPGRARG